eukprot:2417150-Prorocentrum_lima.AAC.1
MTSSLVGSEMCIRDRDSRVAFQAGSLPPDHHEETIQHLRDLLQPHDRPPPVQAASSSRRPAPPLRGSVAGAAAT